MKDIMVQTGDLLLAEVQKIALPTTMISTCGHWESFLDKHGDEDETQRNAIDPNDTDDLKARIKTKL